LASHDRLPQQRTKEPKLAQYPPSLEPGDIRVHYMNKTTGCCFQTQLLDLESYYFHIFQKKNTMGLSAMWSSLGRQRGPESRLQKWKN